MRTATRSLVVEWGDCDAAGIVFYPRYFAMFDWSTACLFAQAMGMGKRAMAAAYGIVGTPMVDTRAKFQAPSTFGDAIVIETRVERIGRASIDIYHRLLKDGALRVEGWEKRVWAGQHPDDPARLKSMPLPQEVIDRLTA